MFSIGKICHKLACVRSRCTNVQPPLPQLRQTSVICITSHYFSCCRWLQRCRPLADVPDPIRLESPLSFAECAEFTTVRVCTSHKEFNLFHNFFEKCINYYFFIFFRKYLCCAVIVSVRVQRFRVGVRLDQVAGTRKSALAVRSFTSRRNRNSGNHQTAAAVEGYDMGDTSSYASDY